MPKKNNENEGVFFSKINEQKLLSCTIKVLTPNIKNIGELIWIAEAF